MIKRIVLLTGFFVLISNASWADTGIAGRVMGLSDVQGFPDYPLKDMTVAVMSKDDFGVFISAMGSQHGVNKVNIPETALLSVPDSDGYFKQALEPGIHIVCFLFGAAKGEQYNLSGCVEINLGARELIEIKYEKMFGASITCDKKDKCRQLTLP